VISYFVPVENSACIQSQFSKFFSLQDNHILLLHDKRNCMRYLFPFFPLCGLFALIGCASIIRPSIDSYSQIKHVTTEPRATYITMMTTMQGITLHKLHTYVTYAQLSTTLGALGDIQGSTEIFLDCDCRLLVGSSLACGALFSSGVPRRSTDLRLELTLPAAAVWFCTRKLTPCIIDHTFLALSMMSIVNSRLLSAVGKSLCNVDSIK